MSNISRRQLLAFFGASAGTTVLAPILENKIFGNATDAANAREVLKLTPVRLPHPLPIYQQQSSFLPTARQQGKVIVPSANVKLTEYNVIDDVVVPPEYERYVIISWGDRVFPNKEEYFGYNNDYTGFVPIDRNSLNDGYLWVNHEYISYPFSPLAPGTPADLAGFPTTYSQVIGDELPNDKTSIELLGEFMYNLGGSIVRITRANRNERYTVSRDTSKNRRIHGLSGLGINRERNDSYKNITAWGSKSYQQGDENYLIGTGSAATQVFNLSSDGLGNRIIGTAYNCSGGTSPWGTILSGEENFQGSSSSFVGVTESVKLNGTQTGYTAQTTGEKFGLVGEKYGWMVEVDPADANFRPRKHTALGRFRHENVAIRAEAGNKLVVYMGDDRRGGHTWKFVSNGTIVNPNNKNNSKLFEDGTLYVAVYNPDGTGRWVPLTLQTPTNPNRPSVLSSQEAALRGTISNNGNTRFPKLPDGGANVVTVANEATELPQYEGKTLADFYPTQGAVLTDAFQAANLVGGTPTARPEDIEIHPRTKEVFISYTDGAPSGDGYADSRSFVVSKYNREVNATQHFGRLYKIIEDSPNGTG
ncbi:PhoX family protein, partial [Aetokthonos hydrillicola]|uniref:PhoX family protein n=1 Tax=Aetokthonos hydrillicola TaxID=1550245 RepID=UPI001ABB292A